MADQGAEIAQISFYLGKEGRTFDSVVDPKAELHGKLGYKLYDFSVDGVPCRFIFFQTKTAKTNPPWLDFVNERLPLTDQIQFKAMSYSANGIVLISSSKRVFAATFGRSAGSCLLKSALEPDFGIKTAMNMCGNEEIRQTKSQSNTITPTQIDRQVNVPSDALMVGLSEAEELRYLSAHIKGDKNITLQGRDNLTIKIIGENKLNWSALISRCKEFLKGFNGTDYIALFPNYRNFQVVSETDAQLLDGLLLKALAGKNWSKLRLGIPEFISEDQYSFSYSNYNKRENAIYAFLDPRQLAQEFDLKTITVDKLKSKKIFAYSAAEDRILPYRKWDLYSCLGFEAKVNKRYFILLDGRWLEVEANFYKSITDFISKKLVVLPCESSYEGIDISDDVAKQNKESIFNEAVCKIRSECILFDRAKLRIGSGRRDKEFCDILDMENGGLVRIINCKMYKDASSINYLFSQSKFYSDAFLRDDTFLSEIREFIRTSGNPAAKKYLAYIPDAIEKLHGKDYRLCLWLLCNDKESLPTKSDMPLIAQYELKLMHDHLRKVCKLDAVIVRFVPVKVKQYVKAHKVKAKP